MNLSSLNIVLQFLGHLHPLVIHLPIGILVFAFFLEILTLNGKRKELRSGINFMIFTGTFFAIIACILGWLLKSSEYSGDLVLNHQNSGIATAVLASVTSLFLFLEKQKIIKNLFFYRLSLTLTVSALILTSHLGASITHGTGYLLEDSASQNSSVDKEETQLLVNRLTKQDKLSETDQIEMNLKVRAILAHNCYQCHSKNKQKGDLALDSKRAVFQGGKSGVVILAGSPEESELYRRISLPKNHDDLMPKKGKSLDGSEIDIIKLWIKEGAFWSDQALNVFYEAPLELVKPHLPKNNKKAHPLDLLIDDYFNKNKLKWPEAIDDKTFIRRAHLDIVGLLPDANKVHFFLNDPSPTKREKLIDDLLADNQNYTQHWLSFWNDLLRNDYSGPGFITGGRKQITNWLYQSLEENKPYDQMVKELVNPDDESLGFIKGIQWRGVVNASQRTEMQAAQNIGQSMLGVNVKCASCHNSFVSNLTLEDAYGFASVFADSPLELNRCDMPLGVLSKVSFLNNELGSVEAETIPERLELLSEVIVKPENGRLYRTITNRIWEQLLGRGIIEPVDEMDKLPWDQTVLDWLAADFISSGHDLKKLMKLIMTSKAYQLPAVNYDKIEDLKSSKYVFQGPIIRRMSAEQYSDAISQVIAPMYYGVAFDPKNEGLSSNRIWHEEKKYDRTVLPEPGDRYFRHTISLTDKDIKQAKVLISVDHSYHLYINENLVSEDSDWRTVEKTDVTSLLKPGANTIAIKASNQGTLANPAGILFAIRIIDIEDQETLIEANRDWLSTKEVPADDWVSANFDDSAWIKVKSYGSNHWDNLLDYKFDSDFNEFARASLVKQHPFMKALGRPTRENVSTSRDDQATLLQALELTNGAFFNNVLEQGADKWLASYGNNTATIIDTLYEKSLNRLPSKKEKNIVVKALGKSIKSEDLQDLFWSIVVSPEFQFIN